MNIPAISILMPTLNSARTLEKCLDSIIIQDYPKEKLEVVIADGGSTDNTLKIIRSKLESIDYQLLYNPLTTGEAGKSVCLKHAKNEIIAFIDSDNILPQSDWLKKMAEPFQDPEIIAAEPLYYTYRQTDCYITRYCALLGMNDPLCLWLGNYDRYCALTGKWTEMPFKGENKGNYLKLEFPDISKLPTIGANGFFIRTVLLNAYLDLDYLADIDILPDILSRNKYKIAKVETGIIHLYCSTVLQFIRKQRRRVRDFIYYSSFGMRKYPWDDLKRLKIIIFCISTVFVIGLLVQSFKGILKNRDSAWLFHPIACWLTLFIYGYNVLKGKLAPIRAESRQRWEQ